MAGKDRVWAIDIGNMSLKAICLSDMSGAVEIIDFDEIEHSKILNSPGLGSVEKDELVAVSVRQFVTSHDLRKADIVIAVPSQNSFARFVSLPPVEERKLPEIVRFEAAQQIPFDINEVQWDWQTMGVTKQGETRIGLFAIKSDVVESAIESFSRENIFVNVVQIDSMALYNYLCFDRPRRVRHDDQATVILDIGTESSTLVICTKSTVWQRSISIGGNIFTKTIAKTFKVSFRKAEKLKRAASMSKHARQIFQAMRPVFTDLASEVQRSIGFYSSSNPGVKLKHMIALGGGTKMRGLLKYLQQSLQIPFEKPDAFKKAAISDNVSAAKFHDSVSDFGIVYGLALQGLGYAKIQTNLLPKSIEKAMAWKKKSIYCIVAALILLVSAVLALARVYVDNIGYANAKNVRRHISNVIDDVQRAEEKLKKQKGRQEQSLQKIDEAFAVFEGRDMILKLYNIIVSSFPNAENIPKQANLFQAFDRADIDGVLIVPRLERKQIFITQISSYFTTDLQATPLGEAGTDTRTSSRSVGGVSGFGGEDAMRMAYEAEFGGGFGGYGGSGGRASGGGSDKGIDRTSEGTSGFIVTISGYSPYRDIESLFTSVSVGSAGDDYFVFSTLEEKLKSVGFHLFEREVPANFDFTTGIVNLDEKMPVGVGVKGKQKIASASGQTRDVLVDPMTKEVISKVAKFDEYGCEVSDDYDRTIYQTNDHWFILKLKIAVKEKESDDDSEEDEDSDFLQR